MPDGPACQLAIGASVCAVRPSKRGLNMPSSIHTLYLLFFGSVYLPYCHVERQPVSDPHGR